MTPANIAGMCSIIGLDIIALTDHNSCRNCPALINAARSYGITVIPGMEFCTAEEVHVLCFFPSLEQALAFDAFVYEMLPAIPNDPMLFGNQLIYDSNDEITGTLDKLLISAVPVGFSELPDLVKTYGGITIPAHIDKPANSLISNLGFIPEDSRFTWAEFHNTASREDFCKRYPYLKNCKFLCSSDAHYLNDIHEPIYTMEAPGKTLPDIFTSLTKI